MSYVLPLIETMRNNRNESNIPAMEAYMKGKFKYLGIKTPKRKEIFKTFIRQCGWPDLNQMQPVVLELWQQEEREFQYLAIAFLDKFKLKVSKDIIDFYQELIITKSWWDSVDGLAATIVGSYFKLYPGEIPAITQQWINSSNMWLQRTCLLFQLKYKTNLDTELLESFISRLNTSKEFFIQKAIGWILREYSKVNPNYVLNYVENYQLASLSKREALKVILRK